jgi:hypothetical protein
VRRRATPAVACPLGGSTRERRIRCFLDPDADRAKQEHDRLRMRLIRYFVWNGCRCPEDLADETFLRVWRRVTEGIEVHASSYFYGVAANILREQRERPPEAAMLSDKGDRVPSSRGGFDQIDLKLHLEDLLSGSTRRCTAG